MMTVTIAKGDATIETKTFAMVTGFCTWMEVTGYGWLNDGCTLTVQQAPKSTEETVS